MTDSNITLLTVDELVEGFEKGELRETHTPHLILAPDYDNFVWNGSWFGEDHDEENDDEPETERYDCTDGFYPHCESYEFTVLWYEIVGNYMDYNELGYWQVEHGGLRWTYSSDAKDEANLRATVEAIWPLAYAKYREVSAKLLERGNVEAHKR